MTLQEILANKGTFGDDIELTIGTEKVNLGQLRDLSAKQQKDLYDKIAGADRREKEAQATALQAADALTAIQQIRTNLEQQKSTKQENNSGDDFDTSEWWAPVRTRFSERDKKIDDAISKLDNLTKAVTQTATIWAEDRWQNQFEKNSPRLKKVEAYKDWDYTKVRDYAAANKILDAHGLPSVEKTIMELTKANDMQTAADEAYQRGLKEGRTKTRLESMPRPSSATGGKSGKGKSAVEEVGLEGLGDDVMDDADLMDQIAKMQDIGSLQ